MISIILALILVGVVLYLVSLIPMDAAILTIIRVVVILGLSKPTERTRRKPPAQQMDNDPNWQPIETMPPDALCMIEYTTCTQPPGHTPFRWRPFNEGELARLMPAEPLK